MGSMRTILKTIIIAHFSTNVENGKKSENCCSTKFRRFEETRKPIRRRNQTSTSVKSTRRSGTLPRTTGMLKFVKIDEKRKIRSQTLPRRFQKTISQPVICISSYKTFDI